AGKAAISGDHPVEIRPVDEVVVNAITDFGPQGGVRIGGGRFPSQLDRLDAALVFAVFQANAITGAGGQMDPGNVFPREPALAPVVDNQAIVNPELYVAGRKGLELIITGLVRPDLSFPARAPIAVERQSGVNPGIRLFDVSLDVI